MRRSDLAARRLHLVSFMSSHEWSGALARMMFDQSPFSSVLYDPEGRIVAANAAFEKLWGVDVSSAPPGYSVLTDPELERQGALDVVRRAFQGEPGTTRAIRYDIAKLSVTGQGKTLWTQGHFYPVLDGAGKVRLVVLTHIDLTDRVEAELKLRYALADLESLQGLTADFAGAIDKQDVATLALERARPAFGAAGGFVTVVDGDHFVVIRYEGLDEGSFRQWQRFPISAHTPSGDALRSGNAVFIDSMDEAVQRYPEAAKVLGSGGFQSFATLPLLAQGRAIGTVSFQFTEANPLNETQRQTLLTFAGQCALAMERAMLYESERKARAEAEAASRAKSQFLATMSHELRTPLNAIDGYAELLELGIRGALNEAQQHDLGRIRRSQKHLLSLIDDVLAFARIESNAVTMRVRTVDVAEAIRAAEDVVAPQILAKGLVCDTSDIPHLEICADADKLHQILLNLLTNAIKFTDAGRIEVRVRPEGDVAAIDISDTGRGVPADRIDAIFEPFVQVESGNTRTNPGTGLGLAISRDLARRMDGDVTVFSTLGSGSTFTVTLPLKDATPPS